ncbi:MAG: hypothetical protein ACI83O_000130 [Patescibacteria group bacterium]|jgi:hypothetical protein
MTPTGAHNLPSVRDLIRYNNFQAELLKENAWYMGEKHNRPIPHLEAGLDFIANGHSLEFARIYRAKEERVEKHFQKHPNTQITTDLVHYLLEY